MNSLKPFSPFISLIRCYFQLLFILMLSNGHLLAGECEDKYPLEHRVGEVIEKPQ